MNATPEQTQALRGIARVFLETVKEAGPLGAPSGPMYAAVMGRMPLAHYEQIMDALVTTGRLRKAGHVFHFIKDL